MVSLSLPDQLKSPSAFSRRSRYILVGKSVMCEGVVCDVWSVQWGEV